MNKAKFWQTELGRLLNKHDSIIMISVRYMEETIA